MIKAAAADNDQDINGRSPKIDLKQTKIITEKSDLNQNFCL